MSQEDVRIMLNDYITQSGIKAKKVCEAINLNEPVLSLFRRGKKQLWPETLEKLTEYLKNKTVIIKSNES